MKKITTLLIILFTVLGLQDCLAQKSAYKDPEPPLFNPVTNCQLRYNYYPNLEAYFDTQKSIYYYKEDGEWITAEELPNGYRGYSIYNKITIYINDYDDENPCQFINQHKKKYPYITNEKGKQLTQSNR